MRMHIHLSLLAASPPTPCFSVFFFFFCSGADFLALRQSSFNATAPPTVPGRRWVRETSAWASGRFQQHQQACWKAPFISPVTSLAEGKLPLSISNCRLSPLSYPMRSSSSTKKAFSHKSKCLIQREGKSPRKRGLVLDQPWSCLHFYWDDLWLNGTGGNAQES